MLIGRGMIASSFARYDDDNRVVVFASGVSNSAETDVELFRREADLLEKAAVQAPLIVYFSSLFDPRKAESPYAKHKRDMESLVKHCSNNFLILRLPQVVGPNNNRFNLVGFIVDRLLSMQPFQVQADATRVILDLSDLVTLGEHFISSPESWNQTIKLAPPPAVAVKEIVAELESLLGVRGKYELVPGGDPFVDVSEGLESVSERLRIGFGPGYCKKVLGKYYGRR